MDKNNVMMNKKRHYWSVSLVKSDLSLTYVKGKCQRNELKVPFSKQSTEVS